MKSRPPRRDPARGVAALEMALVLPALVLIPLGAWDVGRALQAQERLLHGVRAAARHLATGDPQDPTRRAQAVQLAVTGRMSGGSPLVPGLSASHVRILDPKDISGVRQVSTDRGPVSLVTVVIEGVPYTPVVLPTGWVPTLKPVSLTFVQSFF